jgi:hypothetical protein
VLDATTDAAQVTRWWQGRYRDCNIGGRVPESMIVIDVDPRHGGAASVAALEKSYGVLPDTLTTVSGRGDGGKHLFYRRPSGHLSARRLGAGVDLKLSSGYVVLPPSLHPDTGRPYVSVEHPVAVPPPWLVALLRPAPSRQHVATWRGNTDAGRFSLNCLVARINAATEGRRNVTVFGAMRDAQQDGNLDTFEHDLTAAALGIGLPHNEVEAIVRSVRSAA